MGQRLVMNVYEHDSDPDPLLNVYYHWSAYSTASLMEAANFLESYNEIEHTEVKIIDLIQAFEELGARVSNADDIAYIADTYGYETDTISINRNNGLIACTEKTMRESDSYAEGIVNIYLDDGYLISDCFYYVWDREELEDENRIVRAREDLESIRFDRLDFVIMFLINAVADRVYVMEVEEDQLLGLIE